MNGDGVGERKICREMRKKSKGTNRVNDRWRKKEGKEVEGRRLVLEIRM